MFLMRAFVAQIANVVKRCVARVCDTGITFCKQLLARSVRQRGAQLDLALIDHGNDVLTIVVGAMHQRTALALNTLKTSRKFCWFYFVAMIVREAHYASDRNARHAKRGSVAHWPATRGIQRSMLCK